MPLTAVLNLDMDFFTSPPYFGRFYGETKATSFSTFHATSKLWIDSKDFLNKMDFKHRIRGATMRNDNQSYLYIKSMIDQNVLVPNNFTIVNFDSHHDCYIHWDENWYRSVEGKFHGYDNMVAPFINKWVSEIIWVTPDYMTDDMFREQFKYMSVNYINNDVIVNISDSLRIRIKRLKWSDYQSTFFDYKYFCLIMNPEMSKSNPKMISDISKYVSEF